MLDIKLLREKPDEVRRNLERRQDPAKLELLEHVIRADARWRELTSQVNKLRRRRNQISSEISKTVKAGKDAELLKEEAKAVMDEIQRVETELGQKETEVKNGLMRLPNMLHQSVPYGKDETENAVIRTWGEPKNFLFPGKSHAELALQLGIMDVDRAAKAAGSGFYYLRNEMALLDYAIIRYGVDRLLRKGFALIEPPYMIKRSAYEGATDLSDFENVMYKIENAEDTEDPLYLIATSEHAMCAMLKDEVLSADALPIKLCGVSPCFRREIGSHGKYTKGMFRVHQFNKVEQFIFSLPEQSWELHEELQRNSEELYQGLGLSYRVVNVCTGDIGSIAAKKYDIEAWMADGQYREVGSNSNCTDYQARRLNVRYRYKEGQAPAGLVHTLNNTALATSRTMLAIMEQYQQEDGTIKVPKALQPYMNGMETIEGKLNRLKL